MFQYLAYLLQWWCISNSLYMLFVHSKWRKLLTSLVPTLQFWYDVADFFFLILQRMWILLHSLLTSNHYGKNIMTSHMVRARKWMVRFTADSSLSVLYKHLLSGLLGLSPIQFPSVRASWPLLPHSPSQNQSSARSSNITTSTISWTRRHLLRT